MRPPSRSRPAGLPNLPGGDWYMIDQERRHPTLRALIDICLPRPSKTYCQQLHCGPFAYTWNRICFGTTPGARQIFALHVQRLIRYTALSARLRSSARPAQAVQYRALWTHHCYGHTPAILAKLGASQYSLSHDDTVRGLVLSASEWSR